MRRYEFAPGCARIGALEFLGLHPIPMVNSSAATSSVVHHLIKPGTVIDANGKSEPLALGPLAGKPVLLVLRIEEIIEQESLHVSIWGAPDGESWGQKALFWYPQKFYRGATPAALDLSQKPEIRLLQARWETNRWGRGYPRPYFVAALEVQGLEVR